MTDLPLVSLVNIVSGFAFDSKQFNTTGNGMPLIRVRDVGKENSETFYSGDFDSKYIISRGDVIVAMDGEFRVAKWTGKDSLLNQRVCKIIPYDKRVDKNYLLRYLPFELKKIEDQTPFATVKHLSTKSIESIQIPLPPLPTQRHIAAILDAADALRQKTQTLLDKYDSLAQSVFLEMFGDPVRNEKGWEVKKIGEISEVSSGGTPSRSNNEYFNGSIPWVKTGEVDGGKILYTEEHISQDAIKNSACKVYPKNTILVAMYGQGKTRGKVGILGIDATTNQACAAIEPSNRFNSGFVFSLLKGSYSQLRELGRGGNQPNLNLSLVKNFTVIYPPISTQDEFASTMHNIEIQKEKVKVELLRTEEMFRSLLHGALEGRIS